MRSLLNIHGSQARLLLLVLLVASISSGLIHEAWGLSVSPPSKTTTPGGTLYYNVYVTGTLPGKKIQLLVSPLVLGISTSFTINNQYAPYSSVMTVHVSPTKAPGVYTKIYGPILRVNSSQAQQTSMSQYRS
ncbi:MAG: hypothetical protein ACUVTM_08445 [Candidatus Bathyarchaeia archaeon]